MTATSTAKRSHHANRGGHHKRGRGGRVDGDGDLVMGGIAASSNRVSKNQSRSNNGTSRDSTPTRQTSGLRRNLFNDSNAQREILRHVASASANARGGRTTRSSGRPNSSPLEDISVTGWQESKAAANDDGGVSSLVAFLEKRATIFFNKDRTTGPSSPYRIRKHRLQGNNNLIISVPSDDVATILRLNGYEFARSKIVVTKASSTKSSSTKPPPSADDEAPNETRELLRGILSVRYNTDTKLLDLSALGEDPTLQKLGLTTASISTQSKLFPAMMKICDEIFTTPEAKKEAVQSVSLARNALTNLKMVTSLAPTFPDLKNLDLSENQLPNLASISFWKRNLHHLDHLVLTNNPLEQSIPEYNVELAKMFPSLRILNGIQIRSDEEASEQGQLITRLSLRTKLTPVYARQCLEETGWDLDKAIKAFEKAKPNLPADAYLPAS